MVPTTARSAPSARRADRRDRRRVGVRTRRPPRPRRHGSDAGRRKPRRDGRRGVGRGQVDGLGITARTRPTSTLWPGQQTARIADQRDRPRRQPRPAPSAPADPTTSMSGGGPKDASHPECGVSRRSDAAMPSRWNNPRAAASTSAPSICSTGLRIGGGQQQVDPRLDRRDHIGMPSGPRPTPAMSRASVMEMPSKPSSPRSRSVMTARDSVAGTSFRPVTPATRCARTSPRAHPPPLPHRTGRVMTRKDRARGRHGRQTVVRVVGRLAGAGEVLDTGGHSRRLQARTIAAPWRPTGPGWSPNARIPRAWI